MTQRRHLLLLQCFGMHWLFCQANGFPITRETRLTHSRTFPNNQYRPVVSKAKTHVSRNSSTSLSLLNWRGGAILTSTSISSLTQRIVSSTQACWVVLICTVILESCATSVSKQSRDLKSKRLFALACAMYLLSMWGFNLSLAQVPVGIAYAVWSALGTTLVTTISILHFDETMNWKKAVCLLLIVAGVVGLNVG